MVEEEEDAESESDESVVTVVVVVEEEGMVWKGCGMRKFLNTVAIHKVSNDNSQKSAQVLHKRLHENRISIEYTQNSTGLVMRTCQGWQ